MIILEAIRWALVAINVIGTIASLPLSTPMQPIEPERSMVIHIAQYESP